MKSLIHKKKKRASLKDQKILQIIKPIAPRPYDTHVIFNMGYFFNPPKPVDKNKYMFVF